MRRPNRRPNYTETEDITNWEIPPDYIVYKDGADTIAVNGDTGVEDSRNTDSAIVIQYALDNGDNIFVKEGRYDIATELTRTANGLNLIGVPKLTRFRLTDDLDQILKIYGTGLAAGMIQYSNVKDITFQQINTRPYDGVGIQAEYITQLMINHCRFEYMTEQAILIKTVYCAKILDNDFLDCGDESGGGAADLATIDFTAMEDDAAHKSTIPYIVRNLFEYNRYRDISNDDTHVSRARILHNWTEAKEGKPTDSFIYWKGSGALIDGNVIHGDQNQTGIYCDGLKTIVSNNGVENLTYGIDAASGFTIVANNRITACLTRGINGGNGHHSNNIITGIGDADVDFANGIRITEGATVIGNYIGDGIANSAIRQIYSIADGNVVMGNTLISTAAVNTDRGIHFPNGSDDNLAIGNLLSGTFGNVVTNGGTGNTIKHNKGWVTENGGTATILNTGTDIVVTHGLDDTPTVINVTGQHAEVLDLHVGTIGAANFTITTVGAVSADRAIFWEAKVR